MGLENGSIVGHLVTRDGGEEKRRMIAHARELDFPKNFTGGEFERPHAAVGGNVKDVVVEKGGNKGVTAAREGSEPKLSTSGNIDRDSITIGTDDGEVLAVVAKAVEAGHETVARFVAILKEPALFEGGGFKAHGNTARGSNEDTTM